MARVSKEAAEAAMFAIKCLVNNRSDEDKNLATVHTKLATKFDEIFKTAPPDKWRVCMKVSPTNHMQYLTDLTLDQLTGVRPVWTLKDVSSPEIWTTTKRDADLIAELLGGGAYAEETE